MTEPGHVLRVLRVERTVSALAASCAFYRDALGFTIAEIETDSLREGPWHARTARLCLGSQELRLVEYDPPGRAYPPGSTAADLWFQHIAVVTSDMGQAYARLQRHAPAAISNGGPQVLPPQAGGVTAWKFRDPDGHPVELLQFPDGAHPAGIDHSAISVADADAGIAFYCGVLGMQVSARQTNQGEEQQRLDALQADRVDVVALSPVHEPPHIELLAYGQPRGRVLPYMAEPCDIVADRLVLQVDSLAALRDRGIGDTAPGHDRPVTLRDPDGHMLVLVE